MQQDNYTDKKLQQLENQSLPDLSNMDKHWEEMKTMVKPAVKPIKPYTKPKKFYVWLAAASIAGGIMFFAYKYNLTISSKETKKVYVDRNPSNNHTAEKQMAEKESNKIVEKNKQENTGVVNDNQSKISSIINNSAVKNDPIINSVNPEKMVEPKKLLENFFNKLAKNEQEFVINSQNDTMITAKEGTSLYIPANSFTATGNISVSIKEFFSYEDIVANKLTTMSNGQQLMTGGMFLINASSNGKDVYISPGKNITIRVPDTVSNLNQMQLFQGRFAAHNDLSKIKKDESGENFSPQINWIPLTKNSVFTQRWITVLNLLDNPYNVSNNIAHYLIAKHCTLSNDEIKYELEKKYGKYYNKIKVRREWFGPKEMVDEYVGQPIIGDSITLPFKLALKWKLVPKKDSINFVKQLKADSANYASIQKIGRQYYFTIKELGWINCDMFYNDKRPKFNYTINLNDTASNYSTFLVFDKIKSVMQGYATGNKVIFTNVPEGESVKVVCAGVKDGKIISAVHSTILNRNNSDSIENWVAAEGNFKAQLASIGK